MCPLQVSCTDSWFPWDQKQLRAAAWGTIGSLDIATPSWQQVRGAWTPDSRCVTCCINNALGSFKKEILPKGSPGYLSRKRWTSECNVRGKRLGGVGNRGQSAKEHAPAHDMGAIFRGTQTQSVNNDSTQSQPRTVGVKWKRAMVLSSPTASPEETGERRRKGLHPNSGAARHWASRNREGVCPFNEDQSSDQYGSWNSSKYGVQTLLASQSATKTFSLSCPRGGRF